MIPKLLAVLEKEQAESPVRRECVEVLRHIEPERIPAAALPALRAGLTSHDRQVRVESAALLNRLGLHARPESADSVEVLKTGTFHAEPLAPRQPASLEPAARGGCGVGATRR